MDGLLHIVKKLSRICALALALFACGPTVITPTLAAMGISYGTAEAQELTQAFGAVNTLSTQVESGLKLIIRGVAVAIFMVFFLWALLSGNWNFVKLAGMAAAIIGFAVTDQIVNGLLSIGIS